MEVTKRKRTIGLRSVFLRFLLWFCGFSAGTFCFYLLIFSILISAGKVRGANYEENTLEAQRDAIIHASEVTEKMLPDGVTYGVYDSKGNFLYGSLPPKKQSLVWKEYKRGGGGNGSLGYLKNFPRQEGMCIAVYHIKTEFASPILRKHLPDVQTCLVILFFLLFVLESALLVRKFGRRLGQELKAVEEITNKVRDQDLEFEKPSSAVREVDQVMGSLVSMRDALKESLKKQWELEENRRRQLGALVHDVKTPLTVIRGNAQLLEEDETNQESRESLAYILSEADRIEAYIQILQEMLRSEETVEFELERTDIQALSDSFFKRAKMLTEGEGKSLRVEISSFPAYINSTPRQLERAWDNLLSNALCHTPPGGDILMKMGEEKDLFYFSVEDSGEGFTKMDMRRGPEAFYQGDKSRGAKGHYGMGLYMVQSFIRQQGGRLLLGSSKTLKGAYVRMDIDKHI